MNVVDSNPPVVINCPQPIFRSVPLGTPSLMVTWIEPTATDDSGAPPTVMQTHSPGETFTVGVTQVTYIFRDPSGNEERCSFTVSGKYSSVYADQQAAASHVQNNNSISAKICRSLQYI